MIGNMKMKFNILLSLIVLAILGVSCSPEETTYSDKGYVMFEDSVLLCPVTENTDETFDVYVSSTVTCDYDRNYAVQILDRKSNAIEGHHYTLESPNIIIKKGERASSIKMRGNYDKLKSRDSLCVTLQLLASDDEKSNLYPNEVNIQLVKCPPLNLNLFTSNIQFFATFPFSSSETKTFFLKTEKVNDHRLVLKQPFDDKHDLYLDFDDSDILYPVVTVSEQVAFTDVSYTEVYVKSSATTESYVYPDADDRLIVLYLEFYIPTVGRFGTYRYLIRWVDQQVIDDYNNGIN